MDSAALQELIARVRGTAAELAETEQRVAAFTAELAQQDRIAQQDVKPAQQNRTPIAKRGAAGWVSWRNIPRWGRRWVSLWRWSFSF